MNRVQDSLSRLGRQRTPRHPRCQISAQAILERTVIGLIPDGNADWRLILSKDASAPVGWQIRYRNA